MTATTRAAVARAPGMPARATRGLAPEGRRMLAPPSAGNAVRAAIDTVLQTAGRPLEPSTRLAFERGLGRVAPATASRVPVLPMIRDDAGLERDADLAAERFATLAARAGPAGSQHSLAALAALPARPFAADLGRVRLHTGPAAAAAARALRAQAFTLGDDVVFGEGAFDPRGTDGLRLLAHELAHVAQRIAGRVLRKESPSVAPGAAPDAELDDDRNDDRAQAALQASGQPADPAAAASAPATAAQADGAHPAAAPSAAPARAAAMTAPPGTVAAAAPPAPAAPTSAADLPTGDLALIDDELAEHERWGAAAQKVGALGSSQRAAFIVNKAGEGAAHGFKEGVVEGAKSAVAIKLAEKAIAKATIAIATRLGAQAARFTPLPGVGAVIGGVMAGIDLAKRDWKATGRAIANFGKGADVYDTLANSIEAISNVIEVATQVANVIAGVLGAITLIMWGVTVATAGIASPIAGTLTTISLAIGGATMALDAINALVLKQLITMFRALHTFTTDSDPRDVVTQGAAIEQAAGATSGFVGGLVGAKAAEKGMHHASAKFGPKQPPHPRPPAASGDGPTVKAEPPPKQAGAGAAAPQPHADPGAASHPAGTAPEIAPAATPAKTAAGTAAPANASGAHSPAEVHGTAAAKVDAAPSTPPAATGRPASPQEAGTHPASPAPASTGGAAAAPMPEHATPPKHLDAGTAIEVTAVPEHAAIGPAKPSPGATPEAAPAAHEPASGKPAPAAQATAPEPATAPKADTSPSAKDLQRQKGEAVWAATEQLGEKFAMDAGVAPGDRMRLERRAATAKRNFEKAMRDAGYEPVQRGKEVSNMQWEPVAGGKAKPGKRATAERRYERQVEGIATDRNGLQAKARKKFFGQEAGPTTANVDNWHPEGPGATKPTGAPVTGPVKPDITLPLAEPKRVAPGVAAAEGLQGRHSQQPARGASLISEHVGPGAQYEALSKGGKGGPIYDENQYHNDQTILVDKEVAAVKTHEGPNSDNKRTERLKQKAASGARVDPVEDIYLPGIEQTFHAMDTVAARRQAAAATGSASSSTAAGAGTAHASSTPTSTTAPASVTPAATAAGPATTSAPASVAPAASTPGPASTATPASTSAPTGAVAPGTPATSSEATRLRIATPEPRLRIASDEPRLRIASDEPRIRIADEGEPRLRADDLPDIDAAPSSEATPPRRMRRETPALAGPPTSSASKPAATSLPDRAAPALPGDAAPASSTGGTGGKEPPSGSDGGAGGPPSGSDTELDFSKARAGPLIRMNVADAHLRLPAAQGGTLWGVDPASGMTVQEWNVSAARGMPRLDAAGRPLPGPQGDVRTQVRIHSPDPKAVAGSPSQRDWTVGISQGHARMLPDGRWFDTRYGTLPDGRRIDVRPYRRGPGGTWVQDGQPGPVTQPDVLAALADWDHNMAESHIPLFPQAPSAGGPGTPSTAPGGPPAATKGPSSASGAGPTGDATSTDAAPAAAAVAPGPAPAPLSPKATSALAAPPAPADADAGAGADRPVATKAADTPTGAPAASPQAVTPHAGADAGAAASPPATGVPLQDKAGAPATPAPADPTRSDAKSAGTVAKPPLAGTPAAPAQAPAPELPFDTNAPVVERVSPAYDPPPGTPDDVVSLRNQVIDTLGARAAAESHAQAMSQQVKHHEANEKPVADMKAGTDDALEATKAHQEAVKHRDEANERRKGEEDKTKSTIDDYSTRAGALTSITLPMKGLARFTGLAHSLPDEPGIVQRFKNGVLKVNKDSSDFVSQLAKMDSTMSEQKSDQGERKKSAEADGKTLAQTQDKATASGSKLEDAKQTTKDFEDKNRERKDDATAQSKDALATAGHLDRQAAAKEQQALSLAAAMQSWAQGHAKARAAAIEETRRRLLARGYRVTEVREK